MRHNTKPWLTLLAINCILATADPTALSLPVQAVDKLTERADQGGSLHGSLLISSSPIHYPFNDKDHLDKSPRLSNEHHCWGRAEYVEHAQDFSSRLSSRLLSSPTSLGPLTESVTPKFQSADADHPLSCPGACRNICMQLPSVRSPQLQESLPSQSPLPPLLLSPRETRGRPALSPREDSGSCAPNECRDNMENCHQQAIHACQVAGRRREYCRERFSRRCRSEYIQCDFRCSPPFQDPDIITSPFDS